MILCLIVVTQPDLITTLKLTWIPTPSVSLILPVSNSNDLKNRPITCDVSLEVRLEQKYREDGSGSRVTRKTKLSRIDYVELERPDSWGPC